MRLKPKIIDDKCLIIQVSIVVKGSITKHLAAWIGSQWSEECTWLRICSLSRYGTREYAQTPHTILEVTISKMCVISGTWFKIQMQFQKYRVTLMWVQFSNMEQMLLIGVTSMRPLIAILRWILEFSSSKILWPMESNHLQSTEYLQDLLAWTTKAK